MADVTASDIVTAAIRLPSPFLKKVQAHQQYYVPTLN